MKTLPIPVKAGEEIAKKYGYDQVVIIARKVGDEGVEHCTTYGVDKTHCKVAEDIGNYLQYEVMGWPKELKKLL